MVFVKQRTEEKVSLSIDGAEIKRVSEFRFLSVIN